MSIRQYFHFPDFRELEPVDKVITIFSYVPILCYLIVALLLSVLALYSLLNAGDIIIHMFGSIESVLIGTIHGIHALLLTVIIIELFETVTIYLRTKQVPILVLLMVGLTAMIRHILVFSFDSMQLIDVAATAIVTFVLVCSIYLLKDGDTTKRDGYIIKKKNHAEVHSEGHPENFIYTVSHESSPDPSSNPLPPPIQSGTDIIIRYISYIPVFCYIVVALFLSIIAFASLFGAGEGVLLVSTGYGGDFELGIEEAIYAIFLTVIIIGLFETVLAYLTSGHIPIYSLLVVGATVTIRYILLYTLGGIDSLTVMAISAVMMSLVAGLYLLYTKPQKNEDKKSKIITKLHQ